MKIRHAYEGILDGVKAVWTDEYPEGAIVEKEFMFMTADDENHRLKNKETEEICSSVIIQDESEQDNWEEVEREKFPWEKDKENIDG